MLIPKSVTLLPAPISNTLLLERSRWTMRFKWRKATASLRGHTPPRHSAGSGQAQEPDIVRAGVSLPQRDTPPKYSAVSVRGGGRRVGPAHSADELMTTPSLTFWNNRTSRWPTTYRSTSATTLRSLLPSST